MLSEIQSCGYIIGTYIIFEFLGKEVKRYESNFKIRYYRLIIIQNISNLVLS